MKVLRVRIGLLRKSRSDINPTCQVTNSLKRSSAVRLGPVVYGS